VQLDSILDVILRIMKFEEASSQGRRYGNPILDFVREINRYRNPKIHNAATRTAGTQLKQELAAMLSAGFAGHT
jgi:hypothetical protein